MKFRSKIFLRAGLVLFFSALTLGGQSKFAPIQQTGFVYVATNQTSGNAVIQFQRAGNGSLEQVSEISTAGLGGAGNGVGALDPLGSQDSLVLDGTGSLLLVVNAGSNTVSSLQAGGAGLEVLSTVSSGGSFPNSVALNGNLVYVLNAHGTANISGFRVSSQGVLQPIAGSTFNLPSESAAKPHDIRFSPDGTRLLVSDEGAGSIDVFELNNSGLVTSVTSNAAAGSGPFGMRFGRAGVLLNTEANSGSVSSYALSAQDTLTVISPAVADGGQATCWITLTPDGKFGFVSNTGSGTLTTYHVSRNGTLAVANAVAASLNGGAPIDSSLSSDSGFLYFVDSALGRVVFFRVNGASLTQIGSVSGLPTSVQGIAAQ